MTSPNWSTVTACGMLESVDEFGRVWNPLAHIQFPMASACATKPSNCTAVLSEVMPKSTGPYM